jgi:phenylalanyl-tRNA synthetase beta chain
MKVVHSWLKEYVGEKLPDEQAVEDLLNFHAFEIDGAEQVEGETVIDVDVLPNRSSDCLCHRGIARELATILDVQMANDPLAQVPALKTTDVIGVSIEDTNACPRFTASLITDIEVKESPDWLQKRLKALGQRPINNIVDATNYVMYAIGQPMHAYDADLFPKVDGKWQFDVRYAKAGETVSLLAEGGKDEDRVIELDGSELLIVDASSDTPISLAGVKGGRYAGVHAESKNIIIEAAHFHPTLTRKTARRLGIVIDASKRFENEPSRELPPYGQAEIIALIADIAGGNCEGVLDEYVEKIENPEVTVTLKKVNALLGLQLDLTQVADIIKRTGATVVVNADAESVVAQGPFERTDLHIEEDFIEEVGRLYGLDKIVSVVPDATNSIKTINARHYYSEKIRQCLLDLGFSEVVTTSFHKKGKIQLQNSLASDKSYVRGNLSKNLHQVLDANFSHTDMLGLRDVRVFEIGTVFSKSETAITEHLSLALGVRTKGNGFTAPDERILVAACDALEETLSTSLAWEKEKGVAELNLSQVVDTLPAPTQYDAFPQKNAVQYKTVSQYPAISRDIALWVSQGVQADEVMAVLNESAGDLRYRTDIFDEFTKDGKTSYAFRLVFQATDRTLTDDEVAGIMEAVYQVVRENNWEVR